MADKLLQLVLKNSTIFFAGFIFGNMTLLAQQPPQVLFVQPDPQSIAADINSPIIITFDQPVDSQSVNSSTIRVFGRWSGPALGQFQLQNSGAQVVFTPINPFFYGEWITVSISKNVQNPGGVKIISGYSWNFWTETTSGTLDLQEIVRMPVRRPGEGHVQTYGTYAGDLNGDGWTDLTAVNEIPADIRVLLNDGAGNYSNFVVYPLPGGSSPSTNEGADFDNNGTIDFAVGNGGNDKMHVLRGDGSGNFLPGIDTYTASNGVRGLGIIDLNGDGADDIVTANRAGNNLALFMNDGTGAFGQAVFMDASASGETACAIADANGDGIQDVFIGAYNSRELILLLGDGNGGLIFSDKINAGGRPWMLAVGDVNGDGNVDVVSANSSQNNAAVSFGDGQGNLSAVTTYPAGLFPLAIDLGDLDGDGDLDMVTSSFSSGEWTIYENDGSGSFINPRILMASSAASCATLHDHDNDGDLDMTGIDELDDFIFIFENDLQTGITEDWQKKPGFELQQNYPNPFNPVTIIEYTIPKSSQVDIVIYNTLGQKVKTLVSGNQDAGYHQVEWDGRNDFGNRVESGIFFYSVKSGKRLEVKKMILIK